MTMNLEIDETTYPHVHQWLIEKYGEQAQECWNQMTDEKREKWLDRYRNSIDVALYQEYDVDIQRDIVDGYLRGDVK